MKTVMALFHWGGQKFRCCAPHCSSDAEFVSILIRQNFPHWAVRHKPLKPELQTYIEIYTYTFCPEALLRKEFEKKEGQTKRI